MHVLYWFASSLPKSAPFTLQYCTGTGISAVGDDGTPGEQNGTNLGIPTVL